MGIHDRDYVREDPYTGSGPYAEPGSATRWLIGITIVVFLLQLLTDNGRRSSLENPGLTEFLRLDTDSFWQGQVWRVLTHGFLHGDLFHIFCNLLMLYFFGRAVEDRLGSREFVAFYLVAIVLGGLAYLLTHLNRHGAALGASAAVVAVMVVYACHWPNHKVLVFFVFPMPVWMMVAILVGLDAVGFLSANRNGVAVEAHLAGAIFGFLYARNDWRLTGLWQSFQAWRRRRRGPQLRVYREEPDEPRTRLAASLSEDDQLEAQVDAVLEKLSRVGQEGLTQHDREILQKASEVFRKRRG